MPRRHEPVSAVEAEFLAAHAARDWPRAVAAIDRHWTTLIFSRATAEAVFATLREAPEDALRASPKVTLHAEVIGRLPLGSIPVTMPGNAARIDAALRDGTARDLVETATVAMIGRRAAGRPEDGVALAAASRALVLAAATTRFSPAADLAAYWHLQAGQAALHAGDLEQAALDLHHAWSFRDSDVTGYVAPSAAPFLALLAELAGEEEVAARWHQEVDHLAPEGRDLLEWDTMERPRLVAGLLAATDRLDLDQGARLSDALLAQQSFDEIWPVTLFAVVRHLVSAGATGRAEQVLDAALALHPGTPRPGSLHAELVTLARADLALGTGRATTLAALLGGAGPARVTGLLPLYAVHLELLGGDLPAARRAATVAEHAATTPRVTREGRLLGAAAGLGAGAAPAPGAYGPAVRRTASLVPAGLNELLRGAYGDDVPAGHRGLSGAERAVRLTPAEGRALRALATPGSLAEVAARLFVSRNTLKSHLRTLYAKLEVSSREEAVAVGRRLELLGGADGSSSPS